MSVQVIHPSGVGVVAGLLGNGFGGAIHRPGDAQYDEQRKALVPTLDSRPLVVAEAFGRTDVQAAVRTAREHGLPIAVQATGHGTRMPADGGILLKTSAMTSLLIDPERRIAKAGPGVRWGAVIDAAAEFGLAPLAGSSRDVGVTGYTLGGGLGWLARKYGFAADSVVRAEVVTADGRVVTTSADEHPDLFWALRGGTGNFGIVTSLEFRLYPVRSVYAGIVYFDAAQAACILKTYRDWTATVPNELSTAIVLTRRPDGRRVVGLKVMYCGEAALAEHLLKPVYAVAGPIVDGELATMPFAQAAMGGTPARYLDLVDALPDDLLDGLAALTGDAAPTVEIRHWAGAMANPGPGAGPVAHRDAPYSLIIDQEVAELAPVLRRTGRTFVNFLADHSSTATAYTPADHARLRAVKRAYDPENLFHLNPNIAP
ncbi:FAD linked oxidase domain protein [Kribbella flavida DSM 17836]|uniref:FAD linked oxidase domain protein n=1 Tax=Kribbella flavida (strain DSM 17836 / JCM 10339 / NBRC 14399) TaxID=479435 RepID=D2PT52_KRIFD|nr:FAD-binding oxidoreductase [Kribbella flavida]ADB29368.1 FAD linked oxidase domain protein [Kribbella flavida DSM 17836]